MTSYKNQLIPILAEWASHIVSKGKFDDVFLFGSLLNEGTPGFREFEPLRSDIDLLVRFSDRCDSPDARVAACADVRMPLQSLQVELTKALGGDISHRAQVVTLLAVTRFECENGIHRDGAKWDFFYRNNFLDLIDLSSGPRCIGSSAAETFHILYRDATPPIRFAQERRKAYIAISATGASDPEKGDDNPSSGFSKMLFRNAARLRHFSLEIKDNAELTSVEHGKQFTIDVLSNWSALDARFADLAGFIANEHASEGDQELCAHRKLLAAEILASEAQKAIQKVEPANEEKDFLRDTGWQSLRVGLFNFECKIFPQNLWTDRVRPNLFVDDPEAASRVELLRRGSALPNDLLTRLEDEIVSRLEEIERGNLAATKFEKQSLREVRRRLAEGSNAYPRVTGRPIIRTDNGAGRQVLEVYVGESRYGVALVEERKLTLPTAVELRSKHILNSLAVRVAYVYRLGDEWWIEFHRRKTALNATYEGAWDVGAAGYIDPDRHQDPDSPLRISPWMACAAELSEELGIPIADLPHRDHYYFFGIGRNDPTGQLDLLAYCRGVSPTDPGRPPTARVQEFGRCLLSPTTVTAFLAEKRRWVPTAVLTVFLTLEAIGYKRVAIEDAFSELSGRLDLAP